MNERIRLLAEQSMMDYELLPEIAQAPVWIALDDELAEFAELIVRECMKVSNLSLSKHELPSDKIAEHFGVEP